MTKKYNGQVVIYAKKEALQYFIESEFQVCRINAYRYSLPSSSFNSVEQRWTPDLIFIDIDENDFKNNDSRRCKLALSNTLKIIKGKLGGYPTVLSTGGGYHIYQPTEGIVFENIMISLISLVMILIYLKNLRFSKNNLSKGKADKNSNPSLKSCLLRIPGSTNSKYDTKVTIVQKWNGYRPPLAREFIEEFRTYLIQKKIDQNKQRQKMLVKLKKQNKNTNNKNYYEWINKRILANPFPDYRKIIVNLILAPYLVVTKKLSFEKSYKIIVEWLQKCNLLRKLDFNTRSFVNAALATAYKKQIPPMSITTLKTNYKNKYLLLEQQK